MNPETSKSPSKISELLKSLRQTVHMVGILGLAMWDVLFGKADSDWSRPESAQRE